MAGRMFGKRWHGLYEGVSKAQLKKRLSAVKRYWVSVKVVETRDGGYNLYVWGKRKK